MAPTPLIDQFMSKINGYEKFGLVKIGDATKHLFKITNAPWQMGVHTNLQSFLVKPKNGSVIFAYPKMNL
jgi:hypothetical protein